MHVHLLIFSPTTYKLEDSKDIVLSTAIFPESKTVPGIEKALKKKIIAEKYINF